MSSLYRKAALDRLSSPEQLDKLIVITPPRLWAALSGAVLVIGALLIWGFIGHITEFQDVSGIYINPEGIQNAFSASNGTVEKVMVSKGAIVKKGQTLFEISDVTSKKSTQIKADCSGIVYDINCEEGQMISCGEKTVVIKKQEEDTSNMKIVCYVPIAIGKKMQEGMEVIVTPSTVSTQEYGHMSGKIDKVGTYAVNENEMLSKICNANLVQVFMAQGACVELTISLDEDKDTESGYLWSNKKGNEVAITEQTLVSVKIVMNDKKPIEMLVPELKEKLNIM